MKKIIKAAYSLVPFKKQLFSVVRLLRPPQSIYQHLYFKGPFKVRTGSGSFKMMHYGHQVENDLFWGGLKNWESVSLSLWEKLSRQSKIIVDIGANTGVYSLISGAVNPSATIYAFEPLVYRLLEKNVSLNPFNITPSNVAISNREGVAEFFTDSTDFSYTASLNKEHQSESNTQSIKVKTQTLDNLKIIPDLVKIDVERHEPEVIEGFLDTIHKHSPSMLIEVLDDNIGDRLRVLLKDTPYQYYSINETKGTVKRMKEMGKSDDFNVLVCTESVAKRIGLLTAI